MMTGGKLNNVAILVLVDNPFGVGIAKQLEPNFKLVAILVLVDNPFGETLYWLVGVAEQSRNPCSSG